MKSFWLILVVLAIASPLGSGILVESPAPRVHCEGDSGRRHHPYVVGAAPDPWPVDGSIFRCAYGDGSWDGHYEFGVGGAWLMAEEGDGVTGGSLACWGAPADHPAARWSGIFVDERGAPFSFFRVHVDAVNNGPAPAPGEPDCGDGESDASALCLAYCQPPFWAGLDGAYVVTPEGTHGVVSSELAVHWACDDAPAEGTFQLDPAESTGPLASGCRGVRVANDGPGEVLVQSGLPGDGLVLCEPIPPGTTRTCVFHHSPGSFQLVATTPDAGASGSWTKVPMASPIG